MIHYRDSFLFPFVIAVPGFNRIIIIRYLGRSEHVFTCTFIMEELLMFDMSSHIFVCLCVIVVVLRNCFCKLMLEIL